MFKQLAQDSLKLGRQSTVKKIAFTPIHNWVFGPKGYNYWVAKDLLPWFWRAQTIDPNGGSEITAASVRRGDLHYFASELDILTRNSSKKYRRSNHLSDNSSSLDLTL